MSDIPDDNWSERDDRNAEVAPLGFPPGLPAQIELIGRMMMGAIKRFWNKSNPAYLTTGTADDYVVSPEGKTAFIHLYEIIRVRIDRANATTTPTLKFGQTNARFIVKVSPSGIVPLIAGDLVAGQDHSFWYNGTNYVLSNPGTVDSASVTGVLKTANNLSELTATAATARTNIGLGNVDNTSDANKPVSGPQGTAISAAAAAATASAVTTSNAYTDSVAATKLALAGGTMTPGGTGVNYSYQTISNPSGLFLSGLLNGLTLSNNALDAVNDIDIAAGVAASTNASPALMVLASALGKRLDAAWAVGGTPAAAVGGLDTGAIANGTYHLYLMQRSDTGVVDACFSASAVAPTTGGNIPSAYDRFRRVGSVLRESATIIPFTQDGDLFLRSTPGLDIATTNPGTAAVLTAIRVPSGVRVEAVLNVNLQINSAGSTASLYVSSPLQGNDVPSLSAAPLGTVMVSAQASNNFGAIQARILTDTSSQIRTRVSASDANTTVRVVVLGWTDRRGKN